MRDRGCWCIQQGCQYGCASPEMLYEHLTTTHGWGKSVAWSAARDTEVREEGSLRQSGSTESPTPPLTPRGLADMEATARTMLVDTQERVAELRRDLLAEERHMRTLMNLLGVS